MLAVFLLIKLSLLGKQKISDFIHNTDLGSLIGNFDYGYFTMWKFNNFSVTLILSKINFGRFQRV